LQHEAQLPKAARQAPVDYDQAFQLGEWHCKQTGAEDGTERNHSMGVMETAKTAVAIHAPLSVRILAANAAVIDDVALIERDPYGAGWMFRVAPTALADERATLLDARTYAEWLAPRLAQKLADHPGSD